MGKVYCKYHPTAPARWVCPQCQINFCPACVHVAAETDPPVCPVCSRAVVSLGAGNLIRPFWLRIPHFFLFPGHVTPLSFILALSILLLVASNVLMPRAQIVLLILLGTYIVFLKYAFVVLQDTAHGHLQPRPITVSVLNEGIGLPFKQILLILYLAVVNFEILDIFGLDLFILSATLSILAFPASIMVLAIEHSFFKALNPLVLAFTIKRIGASYFILCLFLALLLSGSAVAIDTFVALLPRQLYLVIINFIVMYFSLIMYNMMGYVLYQYHEQVGFDIAEEYQDQILLETQTSDPRFRNIDILIQEGRIADAEQKLIQFIKEHPGEVAPREKLHRLHVVTHNKAGLNQHSADYINRLLHLHKPSEAMRVFLESYHVDPEIKLQGARQRHEVAKLLKSNGHSRAALSLLDNLHKDYPTYEGIPAAYLMVAEIMFEYFGEEQKARQVMEFLLKKYPHHPLRHQIEEYKQVIDRMAPAT